MTDPTIFDRLAIRDLIENWVPWRDAGEWERFRTVWHDDGYMMATWFQGPAAEFIVKSAEAFARGARTQIRERAVGDQVLLPSLRMYLSKATSCSLTKSTVG